MAEVGEGSPAGNIQKTIGAQNLRVEAAKKPLGLVDDIFGNFTHGRVESNYTSGTGGSVKTEIDSGDATLGQRWEFDKDGQIASVVVTRNLRGSGTVSRIRLARGGNGKLQIEESNSTGDLANWAKEFSTAKARIKAGTVRPRHFLDPRPGPAR